MKPRFIIAAGIAASMLAATVAAGPGMRGRMSVEDAQARHAAMLSEADTNGDGGVSLDEFDLPRKHHRGGRHGEGRSDRLPELFTRLDTDNSGALSPQEFEALPAAGRELRREAAFKRLDSDGDGRLTSADTSPMVQHMQAMDSDGDGSVSRAERRSARQALREQRDQHEF